ncbi:MAG: squalene/phytoene synthase family protein [Anaerolineae bacterium]|nr:squalene/phytoene synthase family protein [Anaerolineae bacterium]MCB9130397.1 squalene/phytoene synthase family protein [Anaerolineales bacterium]MCB0228666.1 squalene/phytoene synthase family protein [Anaerolineae bacterium]MCB0233953.1 squalene/phytoene synthase family protein [Anaerolineae bacterium]MCB0240096.1 squalene/phytoene synthase family protein [Anaerolineae bacterium]
MAVQIYGWERHLVDLAHEALEGQIVAALQGIHDERAMGTAYAQCERLTKQHSRTFYLASGLLPAEKRRGARALYAFCRVCDDIVDEQPASCDPVAELSRWRGQPGQDGPDVADPVSIAWADARARFHIPWRYAEQLIEGVSQDLSQVRYPTFDALAHYCYGVASTVGLMAMHIIGFESTAAIPYAVRLGVALQLTNILRDIDEDWQAGRLYLPQNELAAFGLTEDDIAAGRVDDRWRAFMRFQVQRTRSLYDEAMPGIALLDRDGRFAITAAAELYRGILDDIEANDYNVFGRRAHLTTWDKISRLPAIWRLSRSLAVVD